MVLVQVELKSAVEVQDLISFLLLRSYNNFRVTDQESFVSGIVNTNSVSTVNLAHPSKESFCTTQIPQTTDISQNAVSCSEPVRRKHFRGSPSTSISHQLNGRQINKQEKTCMMSSNINYVPSYSEASELVEGNEMDENDFSLDVTPNYQNSSGIVEKEGKTNGDVKASSVLQTANLLPSYSISKNLIALHDRKDDDLSIDVVSSDSQCISVMEGYESTSHKADCNDSFNRRRLGKVLSVLKKKRQLKSSARCAICELNIVVSARSFILHINSKHTKFHLYGCAICHHSALFRGNIVKHIRKHTRAVGKDFTSFLDVNIVNIPISQEKRQKFEEMLEICFGIRLDCCDE
ncbi:hypothetical protein DICVIV_04995 [Dictyocaulus viviparus]|uniref:C2H2-type domain-containing protein n=1 Tax=Dictyocaulus viviparus TaxID=29172 RepID=A0A0D8XYN6_DICVI|nr:hypothetical protein DICVIV_04995 [Dictyocaulus viviparus]